MICEETNRNIFCSTCLFASPPAPCTTGEERREKGRGGGGLEKNKPQTQGKHILPKAIFQDKHSSRSALMKVKPRRTSTQKQTYRIGGIRIFPGSKPAEGQRGRGWGAGGRGKKVETKKSFPQMEKSPFPVVGSTFSPFPNENKGGKWVSAGELRGAPGGRGDGQGTPGHRDFPFVHCLFKKQLVSTRP